MLVGGGVFGRPVIAVCGLSGASYLVDFTVKGRHFQIKCAVIPGKLWFPSNRGTENAHFRLQKGKPRVPSSAGYLFDFRESETQLGL